MRLTSLSRGWWIPVLLKALPPRSLIRGAKASSAACLRQVITSSGSLQNPPLYQSFILRLESTSSTASVSPC